MNRPHHHPVFSRRPSGVNHIHFVGICGIAMGQVAHTLQALGYSVSGSDTEFSAPAAAMIAGITSSSGYAASNLPLLTQAVIVRNGISASNPEILEARQRGLPIYSISEVLRDLVVSPVQSLVIVGTHGKTTTTAMIAGSLQALGLRPSYFYGGSPLNESSQGLVLGSETLSVIEGDEYGSSFVDTQPKFLHYRPTLGVVLPLEFDHPDVFSSEGQYLSMFLAFRDAIAPGGTLLWNLDCPRSRALFGDDPTARTYGVTEGADYQLLSTTGTTVGQELTVMHRGLVGRCTLSAFGAHNALNAAATIAAVHVATGIPLLDVLPTVASVPIARRMQIVFESSNCSIVDDFGHHPTAIAATIAAVRQRWPDRKVTVVFQPAAPITTRAGSEAALAEALATADTVALVQALPLLVDRGHVRLDVSELCQRIVSNGTRLEYCSEFEQALQFVALDDEGTPRVVVFFSHRGLTEEIRRCIGYRTGSLLRESR